jgi:hypothetical protein
LVKPGGKQAIRDVVLTASETKFEVNIDRGKFSAKVTFDLNDSMRLNRELEEWIQIANQIASYKKASKRAVQLPKLHA